jgi:hypothetical protein
MVLAANHRKQIDELFAAPDVQVLCLPIRNASSSPPPSQPRHPQCFRPIATIEDSIHYSCRDCTRKCEK